MAMVRLELDFAPPAAGLEYLNLSPQRVEDFLPPAAIHQVPNWFFF